MAVLSNTYGTVVRVQALVGDAADNRVFGAFTVPSETEVEGFLDDVASEIHGELARAGYPIETASDLETDSPRAFEWLRHLNSVGAAAYLMDSFSGEAIVPPEDLETIATRTQRLYRRYNRLLKQVNGVLLERLGLSRSVKVGAGLATNVASAPRFFRGFASQTEADDE